MSLPRKLLAVAGLVLLAGVVLPARAQEPQGPPPDPNEEAAEAPPPPMNRPGGWRKVGGAGGGEYGQRGFDRQAPPPRVEAARPPVQLVIPAGTWVNVRVNQPISSDRNQPGDEFSATLAEPIVANGFVVARRGQTVAGRVAEAVKAGRAKGTSRLAVELTELSLADGQQMPVRTQLMQYAGGTSKGRDATAIGAATGAGAAIGAAADGGFGAGMGAIAGAGASAIGVLLTRGRATEIYPEAVLTFRTEQPITVMTERSEQAFQPVQQGDYSRNQAQSVSLQRRGAPGPGPVMYPPVYGGGWGGWGWPYYYPRYYGPSFVYFGGGGWGRGHGRWR